MMFLYNILIHITRLLLRLIGVFNTKLKLGITGRKLTFSILKKEISKNDNTLWFHCASLGEFEQGLPVFKELRKLYPNHKFVLSFFSPSGYEVRKNTEAVDVVVYLPWDTKANAERFLDLVHPELIIFVKYEVWPNMLMAARNRNIKAILISALFRNDQIYFKPYGQLLRKALFSFDHIFTQNEFSKKLLEELGYNSITVSGDTRFDRVYSQLSLDNNLGFVETFKQNELCVVAGSTWPEDESYFIGFINSNTENNTKFIIVPHNINSSHIDKLKKAFKVKTILYSEKDEDNLAKAKVLIIDAIGFLSKIYSYGSIAYVGGSAGKTGLHNTLEPAVFGIPIIIGENYFKFPEAIDMIEERGMVSIKNQNDFNKTLLFLITNPLESKNMGSRNFNYIEKNRGAVIQIIDYLRK